MIFEQKLCLLSCAVILWNTGKQGQLSDGLGCHEEMLGSLIIKLQHLLKKLYEIMGAENMNFSPHHFRFPWGMKAGSMILGFCIVFSSGAQLNINSIKEKKLRVQFTKRLTGKILKV